MAGLESEAAFAERAKAIGMREDFLKGLQSAGVKTFGKLAYICAGGPKAGDDGPLLAAVKTLTGNEPAGADLIDLRRLWAEAQALSLSDLRTRVERTHSDIPKEMPLAERLVRVERQKSLLRGLVYNEYVEPAHSLVDRVMHMIEVGCIHYLAPEKCPSRHDEINVTRPEQQLTFDGQGMVKIAKRELDLRCDISGELRLRDALRRKALAFDLAGLASFERLEEWRTQMFQAMTRQPPAGYKFVTTQQVMAADRQLWGLVSQQSRRQLIIEVGNPPPLDKRIEALARSSEVGCYMQPLPASSGGGGGSREKPPPKKRPTKEDRPDPPKKHKNDDRPSIKELLASLPEGCSSKNKEGKFRCLYFNKGLCRFQKKKRCNLGLHECYFDGCNRQVPYVECSH